MSNRRPQLSNAAVPLTHEVEILDERGRASAIHIPAERPLTVYVDKRELVTLMTLGGAPEALTLGYLRNQRLVKSLDEVESVQVDWAVEAVAVKTRNGIANVEERTAKRVVTTGCGQGSVFGGLMDEVDTITLDPDARLKQSTLYRIVDNRWGMARCLEGLARAWTHTQPEQAVRLFGAAAALRQIIHVPAQPRLHAIYERLLTALRATLGEAIFGAAWALGQAMPLQQILDEAPAVEAERQRAPQVDKVGNHDQPRYDALHAAKGIAR